MRTVIYARFSSDQQNPRSVADQIALCRQRAEREGWPIVATFEDCAISGAAGIGPDQRPGLNAMLALVEAGGIDQVLAESTDRITRHVADAHNVRERIEYAGARLFTLFDGTVTPMIGLVKGFMDAQFRTDLAQRVRRGQNASVTRGKSTGGVAYGYRRANRIGEDGELIRGLREIDDDKADVVRRIYREFAAGQSARAIAKRLNADGIAAPRSATWDAGTLRGHKNTDFGILRNPVYVGVVVYGRSKVTVNPVTRRKIMRPNLVDPRTSAQAPHLRIIDQPLWDAVQAQLAETGFKRPEAHRRPTRLLSTLGVCGDCGASWVIVSAGNWGCSHYARGQACTNNRSLSNNQYEQRVLADLKANMLAPDVVAAYVREYHRDFARQAQELARDRSSIERKLGEATRKVDRLVKVIADGGGEFAEFRDLLATAKAERDRLQADLASQEALPVLALHPGLADDYRRQIEDLETALADDSARLEAVPKLRALIGRIVVTASAEKKGVIISVERRVDQVLEAAQLRSRKA